MHLFITKLFIRHHHDVHKMGYILCHLPLMFSEIFVQVLYIYAYCPIFEIDYAIPGKISLFEFL